jgi:Domain of unknown function (DUF6429)
MRRRPHLVRQPEFASLAKATLALLYLGLREGARVWKSFDWEAMNRLHEKGLITDHRSGE